MTGVLLGTLVWTGVLIAAVLVLRRPVARHFGPEAAYALWALPAARLVLPPLTLPAWMAPAPVAPDLSTLAAAPAAESVTWQPSGDPAAFAPAGLAAPHDAAPQAGFDLLAMIAALPLAELLLAVWLGGAGVVLWRRFAAYFMLRGALLAEGREVGRVRARFGWVRLVETPATAAPLAMGVLDPVIALPPGFLALHDRPARDLALAHELAHHRGGDLIVNVLVQPLFALHWWSPLGRYGWLALRRDQEAACDARVMARCGGAQRAAYAALIARFAAAPGSAHHAALTAPMACPVLGEKSIIHRLRSLAMSDLSPRRRLAGRALLGAGLLALPLTATVTYAASDSVLEAPQPPEPPAPPLPPQPPEPPLPPVPPMPPEPPAMTAFDPDMDDAIQQHAAEQDWHAAEAREAHAHAMESYHAGMAAHQEALASMNAALAEAERVRAEIPRIVAEAMAEAEAARTSGAPRVVVRQDCRPGSEEVAESTAADGTQVVSICHKRIFASARQGLEEARAEIASDPDMPEYARKQVLRSLDRQIARWRESES